MIRTTKLLSRDPSDRIQVLDAEGHVVTPELVPDFDDETFVAMYRDMQFCRRFDERIISLQRQGRLGTYSSLAGQEGAQIGSTYALADDDIISYQYREHGAVVARGFPWEYLLYWAGDEHGNAALADENILPLNITIADHLPHVVGMAWAAKLQNNNHVTVAHFGDGATSEGDFHEALNFAGVFDVPAVFICNNNQWAISVPVERQTASATFAQKAHAYGFEGVQVDGMDPLAMYAVTHAARKKAKQPTDGHLRPTLIEAVQYRFGAHTTADDPSVYRDQADVERWRQRDPLSRFESFLRNTDRLDDNEISHINSEIDATLANLIEPVEEHDANPDEMFDYTYAEPTNRLRNQREYLRSLRKTYGDEALLQEE